MAKYYVKIKCPYCGMVISNNGLGWSSHMRTHVREGIAVERRDGSRHLYFDPVDDGSNTDMWEDIKSDD